MVMTMTTLVEQIKHEIDHHINLLPAHKSFDISQLPDVEINAILLRYVLRNKITTKNSLVPKDFKLLISKIKARIAYLENKMAVKKELNEKRKLKVEQNKIDFLASLDENEKSTFEMNLNRTSIISKSAFLTSIVTQWLSKGNLTKNQFDAFNKSIYDIKHEEIQQEFYIDYQSNKTYEFAVKVKSIIEDFEIKAFNNRGTNLCICTKYEFVTPEKQIITLLTSSLKIINTIHDKDHEKFFRIEAKVRTISKHGKFVLISAQGLKFI
jgi:hypothetical protein